MMDDQNQYSQFNQPVNSQSNGDDQGIRQTDDPSQGVSQNNYSQQSGNNEKNWSQAQMQAQHQPQIQPQQSQQRYQQSSQFQQQSPAPQQAQGFSGSQQLESPQNQYPSQSPQTSYPAQPNYTSQQPQQSQQQNSTTQAQFDRNLASTDAIQDQSLDNSFSNSDQNDHQADFDTATDKNYRHPQSMEMNSDPNSASRPEFFSDSQHMQSTPILNEQAKFNDESNVRQSQQMRQPEQPNFPDQTEQGQVQQPGSQMQQFAQYRKPGQQMQIGASPMDRRPLAQTSQTDPAAEKQVDYIHSFVDNPNKVGEHTLSVDSDHFESYPGTIDFNAAKSAYPRGYIHNVTADYADNQDDTDLEGVAEVDDLWDGYVLEDEETDESDESLVSQADQDYLQGNAQLDDFDPVEKFSDQELNYEQVYDKVEHEGINHFVDADYSENYHKNTRQQNKQNNVEVELFSSEEDNFVDRYLQQQQSLTTNHQDPAAGLTQPMSYNGNFNGEPAPQNQEERVTSDFADSGTIAVNDPLWLESDLFSGHEPESNSVAEVVADMPPEPKYSSAAMLNQLLAEDEDPTIRLDKKVNMAGKIPQTKQIKPDAGILNEVEILENPLAETEYMVTRNQTSRYFLLLSVVILISVIGFMLVLLGLSFLN